MNDKTNALLAMLNEWANKPGAHDVRGLLLDAAQAIAALQATLDQLRLQRPVQIDGDVMALAMELAELKATLARVQKERDEGLMAVLPCKVGDTVYSLNWNIKTEQYVVHSREVKNVRYDSADDTVTVSDGEYFRVLGKTVFLTRAEAEAALEGGKKL